MERVPVESSSLASIGYEARTQTLELEYRNGRVYRYFDVPTAEYVALMTAESKGQQVNHRIKGSFAYEQL